MQPSSDVARAASASSQVIPNFNQEELTLISERNLVVQKGTERPGDFHFALPSPDQCQLELLLVILCYQFLNMSQFVVEVFAAVLLLAVIGVSL